MTYHALESHAAKKKRHSRLGRDVYCHTGDGLNSNDILTAVQHPDPTSGNPSSSQQDSYLVNALGDVTQATDRNGNVHQYSYDVLNRLTSDAVTTLGTGVDGSVRRIQYAYDGQGNLYLTTS